jgi:hypothetical protein
VRVFRLEFGVSGDDDDQRVHDERLDNHCARDNAVACDINDITGSRSLS